MGGFLDAWGFMHAAWPVVTGLLIVLAVRRQKPVGGLKRLLGGFAAALLIAVAVSPRDPLTGQVIANQLLVLLAAVGTVLGFICLVFDIGWE
jgi:hypothetical protein